MTKQTRIMIVTMALFIGAFAVGAYFYMAGDNDVPTQVVTTDAPPMEQGMGFVGITESQKEALIRPDSPAMGPEDASVTVVEFLDPECESCRAVYPYVKDILGRYERQVRFVVRYMPYHTNSELAARANEAAGIQGKYWEMQQVLFETQDEWGHQAQPQTEKFVGYAQELGLDVEKFKVDLESQALKDKIARDKADATTVGIRGTPSFYVNGEPLIQLDPNELEKMIQERL